MRTLRRRIGSMGLLVVVLSAGLLWTAQPVGAAGTPPIILLFAAWAENQDGFTTPHLSLLVEVDDPDGQVPRTIQSVVVTDPHGLTYDLTNNFKYPNLNFQGEYFLDAGTTIPTGTYTVSVTDTDGNMVTATDVLTPFPALIPATITSPTKEQILTTTTPIFTWSPVASAGGVQITIRNADEFTTFGGDFLYFSLFLSGTTTQFALPAGVIEPGRRYVLQVWAFDTASGLPTANIRAVSVQPFSVAGPKVALLLNQRVFHTGDTLKLGASIRNDGAPVLVHVHLWAGAPTIPDPLPLLDADVTIPSTAPDVSLVANDILVVTFTTGFPAGTYMLGIRFSAGKTEGIMAQSMVSFRFAP